MRNQTKNMILFEGFVFVFMFCFLKKTVFFILEIKGGREEQKQHFWRFLLFLSLIGDNKKKQSPLR